jgi:hypothetical protein
MLILRCDLCDAVVERQRKKSRVICIDCQHRLHNDYSRERARNLSTSIPKPSRLVYICQECGIQYESSRSETIYCSKKCKESNRARKWKENLEASKSVRNCLHCGVEIPKTMRADAKFCSEVCNSAAHQLVRNLARRAGDIERSVVFRLEIAERDNWICGICHEEVDRTLSHPDPLCASVDHIIPLARGGTNDLDNLQISHLRCNLSKGARS